MLSPSNLTFTERKMESSQKLGTFMLNKPSGVGSALGMNATERTSAASRSVLKGNLTSKGLKKELLNSSSRGKEVHASIGEFHSSSFSQEDQASKHKPEENTTGKMLDSDGF